MIKLLRLVLITACAQLIFATAALASTYGSGTYNNCAYNTGCAASVNNGPNGATNGTTGAAGSSGVTAVQGSHLWLWLSIVAVILAALIFLWLIFWRRRRDRDNTPPPPSSTPPTFTPGL